MSQPQEPIPVQQLEELHRVSTERYRLLLERLLAFDEIGRYITFCQGEVNNEQLSADKALSRIAEMVNRRKVLTNKGMDEVSAFLNSLDFTLY